jgi:glycerol uptake facilitator-like aquaporin
VFGRHNPSRIAKQRAKETAKQEKQDRIEARRTRARSNHNEAKGIFILILAGCSTVIAAGSNTSIAGPAANSLTVLLVFGAALTVIAYVLNGEFNPAITISKCIGGQLTTREAIGHIWWQLIGSLAAGLALRLMWGRTGMAQGLGATHPVLGTGFIKGTLIETGLLFVLDYVILAASRIPELKLIVPLIAGLTLAVCIDIGGPFTGGAINLFRAFGPMVLSHNFAGLPDFFVATLLASTAVGFLHRNALRRAAKD